MSILETDRLALRPFCLADADQLRGVFEDPEVMRFGDGVQNLAWIIEWIGRRLDEYCQASGIEIWAVTENHNDQLISYCGLHLFPDVCGRPETEVGYRLARPHWGNGYATEAALAVRNHAFETLRLTRLISLIDPQNVRSIRVAEKLGMQFEQDVTLPGYTHPDRVYAINFVSPSERRI